MYKKVLVVEDDKDTQDYYKVVFSDYDIDLIWANNGLEALEIIEKEDIDLIILDLIMPVMGGEKFLRKIRHEKKLDIPVVISSVDKVAASKLAKIVDVQGCFFKLAKLDDLYSLVNNGLAQSA